MPDGRSFQHVPAPIEALHRAVTSELPGWKAQALACPPGRPRDVQERLQGARKAGVLALICPTEDGRWGVVLMRRTEDGTPHSGQLSFPGGTEERGDGGDLCATARRECWEELGVPVDEAHVVGPLTSLYIPPSDFWVQPYVAWTDRLPEFALQADEVADAFVHPLDELPDPREVWPACEVVARNRTWNVPGWPCRGTVLWGATAMMLAELRWLWGNR